MKNRLNAIDTSLLNLALQEDLGWPYHDVTTQTLFAKIPQCVGKARIISKHPEPIVLYGLGLAEKILSLLAAECVVTATHQEGATILSGETLMTLTGPMPALLMAERTLLNFLQRLSAIATLTAKFVAAVSGTQLKILDTRKTTPGFRHLEKYAVHCGGGVNHRFGLYDALMIKDTHIDALGGVAQTLAKLPSDLCKQYPVIIEVRTQQELQVVLQEGQEKVSRILLDNMDYAAMQTCVALCQGKMPTEASGNMSLARIRAVADCGVDFASVGVLTHSAGCIDLSMKCD